MMAKTDMEKLHVRQMESASKLAITTTYQDHACTALTRGFMMGTGIERPKRSNREVRSGEMVCLSLVELRGWALRVVAYEDVVA